MEILGSLGLVTDTVVANDPFFGRVGRILAENQRSETLKFEIVTPIISVEQPTAIAWRTAISITSENRSES